MTTYQFATADRTGDNRIAQWEWGTDSSVIYSWTADRGFELIGTPIVDLDLGVDGHEARLFARFLHEGEPVTGVRATCHVGGPGSRSMRIDYPTQVRSIAAGESIGLEVSVSDPLFLNARRSDGVRIEGTSRLQLPQRPQ
jgi:hypothetical protein